MMTVGQHELARCGREARVLRLRHDLGGVQRMSAPANSTQGRRMIRERVMALGKDSIYNLTGLVRTFPLQRTGSPAPGESVYLLHPLPRPCRTAGAALYGGRSRRVQCRPVTRVSAAMLAIMLGTLKPVGVSSDSLTRGLAPSVQQAVEVMGATFQEVQGLAALERANHEGIWHMLAITPLTPSMYHLPAADVAVAIDMAKAAQLVVFVDDAHMMSRSVFYDEPVAFGLGILMSPSGHSTSTSLAARRRDRRPSNLMQTIMAQAFQLA